VFLYDEVKNGRPFSSVSQVSIVALGIGLPEVSSTRPSTYKYSPLPSEAMASPKATATHQIPAWFQSMSMHTIWSIWGKEWSQYGAFSSKALAGLSRDFVWIIDSVYNGRNSKDIGQEDEFLTERCACLACSSQELDCRPPLSSGDARAVKRIDQKNEELEHTLSP
jgi:hypothetical protein